MPDPLAFDNGGSIKPDEHDVETAPVRFDEKRNGPDVPERLHGVLFACASGDPIVSLPAGRRLHALYRTMDARILALCGRRTFSWGCAVLDPPRVFDPPIHFPL